MTYSCLCKNAMKGLFTITRLCRWEIEVQRCSELKQYHMACMALKQCLIPDPASHHTSHDFTLPLWLTQIASHPRGSLHMGIVADERQNLNTFLNSPWSLTHKLSRQRRKHPWATQVWGVWVHLHMGFFHKYSSTTLPTIGWVLRCGTTDTEESWIWRADYTVILGFPCWRLVCVGPTMYLRHSSTAVHVYLYILESR